MEDNKYYIPDIEEFHIGFEYELLKKVSQYDNQWRFNIIKKVFIPTKADRSFDWIRLQIDLEDKEIRVKYLDFDDVKNSGILKQDKFTVMFVSPIASSDGKPYIGLYSKALNQCMFSGMIKNKSELKTLMKQMGI